jgi:hypothetical protein
MQMKLNTMYIMCMVNVLIAEKKARLNWFIGLAKDFFSDTG